MQSSGASEKSSCLFITIWLLALMALAAWIRVSGVGIYHFSTDELYYYYMADAPSAQDVWRYSLNETHLPLFQILLHYWMLISSSPASLRGLPLLFGLLLIPLFYRIGSYLEGQAAGMCCALLVATGYGEIVQSYLLRNYAFYMVLLSLAFFMALRWRSERRGWQLAAYVLLSFLAYLTDFSASPAAFSLTFAENCSILLRKAPVRPKQLGMWSGHRAFFRMRLSPLATHHGLFPPGSLGTAFLLFADFAAACLGFSALYTWLPAAIPLGKRLCLRTLRACRLPALAADFLPAALTFLKHRRGAGDAGEYRAVCKGHSIPADEFAREIKPGGKAYRCLEDNFPY